MAGLALAIIGLMPVVIAPAAGAVSAQGPAVHVYPAPGTSTISPTQQISFRGVSGSHLPTVKVTGSQSGQHIGRWVVQSDGGGATWEPSDRFRAGEKVTVSSSVAVAGTNGSDFSYTVSRPASVSPQQLAAIANAADPPPASSPGGTASAVRGPAAQATPNVLSTTSTDSTVLAAPTAPPAPFITRPDLRPPSIATKLMGSTAPGLLLSTPLSLSTLPPVTQTGAEITDNSGNMVWFNSVPTGAVDLQEITYMGQPALSYHQDLTCGACTTTGFWVVLDTHYNQIATISPDGGYQADGHALEISPDGTKALLDAYNPVIVDDTASGGPPDLQVLEGVIQEIDLKTGAMDFEWHSLGTDSNGQQFAPLSDSYFPAVTGSTLDYIHINSMQYVDNYTILFTGRHTSTVYKLSLTSGQILWRMGGKDARSRFSFTDGDSGPSFAHDVQLVSPAQSAGSATQPGPVNQISVYDNGVIRPAPQQSYGRGVVFNLNEGALTASVAKQWVHAPNLFGLVVGSNRLQSNGDQLVSYGSTGYADEFNSSGNVVWASQAQVDNSVSPPNQVFSYRTLRADWHAIPGTPPAIVVNRSSPTAAAVTSSWNGATDVTAWQLYAGPSSNNLHLVTQVPKAGFETTVNATVAPSDSVFQMRALNGSTVTGISHTTGDAIAVKYAALGGASSFLGAPTGGEQTVGSGLQQAYQGGYIYSSAASGTFSVRGAILVHYQSLGGPTGILGFPTSDEGPSGPSASGGRSSSFQGGIIYWTAPTGAFEVQGAILGQYLALNGPNGTLGFPTSDEMPSPAGGRVSTFQGGFVYWSPSSGAFEVQGAILGQYLALNGPAGILGFPTSNEGPSPAGGRVSTFQGGFVYWSPSTGAFEVQGAILGRYLSMGGPASFLGFPTTNEFSPTPSTRQSNFQNGHAIVFNYNNGTTTVF